MAARPALSRRTVIAALCVTLFTAFIPGLAMAIGPDDAKGRWLSADGGAVIEFKPCDDKPAALCGRIVWDKDAGKANDTCGIQIAQLDRYENEAWRDGWVYDPRDKKKYKGALRVKGGDLYIRAYIGTEILGQTEQMKRVAELPATPVCKS
ncbi:DUF2147 domain-containing protein [Roseateles chitinivorans]|uniref:DUF2147 domain-containing protein n=1 Tax=Roseateles chitinivorans TaxID=2917965 RepID=UPI003D665DB2